MGWALSVHGAWVASSEPASTRDRRRRPRPRSWYPGCTNSMARNQTCSRRSAETNPTTWPPAPAGSASIGAPPAPAAAATATRKPGGSVARRCPSSPSSGPDDGGMAGRPTRRPYSVSPACQTPTQAGRSPGRAGRSRTGGSVPGAVVTWRPGSSRRLDRAADRRLGCLALELGRHEDIEVAVKNGRRVRRLHLGPVILDHLVGMQDVAPDLVSPAGLDVLAPEEAQLDFLLLQPPLEDPGRQVLGRGRLVLGRGALVLAGHHDAGRDVDEAHRRVRLLDVLAAGPGRAVHL